MPAGAEVAAGCEPAIRFQRMVPSACSPSIGLVRLTRSGEMGKNWTGISRISALRRSSSESNKWLACLSVKSIAGLSASAARMPRTAESVSEM